MVLTNGRVLEGRLILIDRTHNLCFDNCREVFGTALWKTCVNMECQFCQSRTKFWDVVSVQMDMIEHIDFHQ